MSLLRIVGFGSGAEAAPCSGKDEGIGQHAL
jgi:hypothetical protein